MHRNLHWLSDNGLASFLWAPDSGGGSGGGGNNEESESEEDEGDEEESEEEPKRKAKTFTQEQMNRTMAREKSDGKKAGRRELLEELGVKDVQEAKTILEKYRESQDSQRTEAEKLSEQAKKDRDSADQVKREALKERNEAKVERQLLRANIKDGKETRAIKLLDLDLEGDLDADDIKSAVEDLVEEFPDLFTSSKSDDEDEEDDPPKNQNRPRRIGDPGRPPQKKAKADAATKARSKLEERHGRTLAKSSANKS
jgi:hypothetical protein